MEIVEIQQPNSGRDAFPQLLKRSRLPKNATSNHPDVSRIGASALSATADYSSGAGSGADQPVYYTDRDLKVGDKIKVFTRELELCGCDKFTQEYYVKTYGASPDDYHPLEVPTHPLTHSPTYPLALCRCAVLSAGRVLLLLPLFGICTHLCCAVLCRAVPCCGVV